MLFRVTVDGFRSLRDFSLTLHPGLNILIGPNGSGKTNIISFFKFLSKITDTTLPDAVSQMGGVGVLFEKQTTKSYKRDMIIKLVGQATSRERIKPRRERVSNTLSYIIELHIKVSDDFTEVFFSRQCCRIKIETGPFSYVGTSIERLVDNILTNKEWDLELTSATTSPEVNGSTNVRMSSVFEAEVEATIGVKEHFTEIFKRIMVESVNSETSVVSIGRVFPFLNIDFVTRDLISDEPFNIVPSRIKENEDLSTPFGVNADGSGLSATLYQLKKGKSAAQSQNNDRIRKRSSKNVPEDANKVFAEIRNRLKVLNESIEDLIVDIDPLENTIKVRVVVRSLRKRIELPLNFMSDGTLKWLALTTAVMTASTTLSIEEPENYLHPLMQREVLSFIRSHSSRGPTPSFFLMSTHSETLLNAARASECIIVTMEDGQTIAKRPEYPEEIDALISTSGFGIGHMFISGSLNYA